MLYANACWVCGDEDTWDRSTLPHLSPSILSLLCSSAHERMRKNANNLGEVGKER